MARKFSRSKRRFRRKHHNRKISKKEVKSIVKKEVGKTRENQKMFSFMTNLPIRSINNKSSATAPLGWGNAIVYSLTGGYYPLATRCNPEGTIIQDVDKALFVMRPYFNDKVSGYGQGGAATDNAASTTAAAELGVHTLEGNECYLKSWRARIFINNDGCPATTYPTYTIPAVNPQASVTQNIRVMVVETRRPLQQAELPQQIFCQMQSGTQVNTSVLPTAPYADSTLGFLNFSVIKKVHYDKVHNLGGSKGDNETGAWKGSKNLKLHVPINKKARWNYSYKVDQADQSDEGKISYMGPYIYLIMTAEVFGAADGSDNLALEAAPRCNITSMLTYYDD